MTSAEAGNLTPHELVELWRGYIWRKQQQENMLASLVTVWIANFAGKVSKKRLSVKDIFSDGRFKKSVKLSDDDNEIIAELYK